MSMCVDVKLMARGMHAWIRLFCSCCFCVVIALSGVCLLGCSQSSVGVAKAPIFPVGEAWEKLSLYEKEQVMARYEKSKRQPQKHWTPWSLLTAKREPDVLVTLSPSDGLSSVDQVAGSDDVVRYGFRLSYGDCHTVEIRKPAPGTGATAVTHAVVPVKVCWRRQQLTITDATKSRKHAAVMRILPHPLWSSGLDYPDLPLNSTVTQLTVRVRLV